jgi:hypothetical protein
MIHVRRIIRYASPDKEAWRGVKYPLNVMSGRMGQSAPTLSPAFTVAVLVCAHPIDALRPQIKSVESGLVLGKARRVSGSVVPGLTIGEISLLWAVDLSMVDDMG